jgi:hypothetical protein
MANLYQFSDFKAVIRIFREDEGGRKLAPFNGIRWDFNYAEELPTSDLYMIWPDFIDEDSNSLPTDKVLPIDRFLRARMSVVVDEMRAQMHRSRIKVGTQFFCCEGPRRVAEGEVRRITHLHIERVTPTSFGLSWETKAQVVALIHVDRRIDAVRVIRDATGGGLAESRTLLEAIIGEMVRKPGRE